MKPSERMEELLREERSVRGYVGEPMFESTQARAIVRFLDEWHERIQALIKELQLARVLLENAIEALDLGEEQAELMERINTKIQAKSKPPGDG